jgi:hypothetical protein
LLAFAPDISAAAARNGRESGTQAAMSTDDPVFAVVRGSPTDEEVAALVAVLTLTNRRSAAEPDTRPSGWSAYWRTVKAPIIPGPDAWRMSVRP